MHRLITLTACLVVLGTTAAAQMMPTTVLFDRGQNRLTPAARSALNTFARTYASAGGGGSIVVSGHTATDGQPAANVQLSNRRASATRDYLISVGVPSSVITTEAFGETRLLVQTADGVRERRNDRVEITVGPSSGW